MTTEVTASTIASTGLREITFTREQIDLIKRTIAKDHTDDELALFLNFCKAKRLDPFAREIYSIKRKDKATIQMGIDGLRARGEDTGKYAGQETFWCGPTGEWVDVWISKDPPMAAKVAVYRKDTNRPFTGIAKWSEYKPAEDFMWQKMPANQLAKCAEALALRKAFPRTLGGIYVAEEMAGGDHQDLPPMPQRISEKEAVVKVQAVEDQSQDEPQPKEHPDVDLSKAKRIVSKFEAPCLICEEIIPAGADILYIFDGPDKGRYHVAHKA